MTSLNKLKRRVEQTVDGRVSIKYDDAYGEYVELAADTEAPLSELETICEEANARMKVKGQNFFGEYEYVFR